MNNYQDFQGFAYIAIPTDGSTETVKLGYTTNTLKERMKKGAKGRKFRIVSAVGIKKEAPHINDIVALLQAIETVAHYNAIRSGLVRMISHDWMASTSSAWVSLADLLEGGVFEGLIYKAIDTIEPRLNGYLQTIKL